MRPIENLTVAITNFKRSGFLDRALVSVRGAGVRRVCIASVEGDESVEKVIKTHSDGWLSFDVARISDDIGCNNTWMLAAYQSQTDRIIILHDDDMLCPEFGNVYESEISKAIDQGDTFVTWRAGLVYNNLTTKPTEYWDGPTKMNPSTDLLKVVANRKRLSLSPIVSVLDRKTVIAACKESEQTLVHNDCLERPGMLLGTEIVVYMRHIQKYKKWLYVDKVLSRYGSHDGSGTIKAQNSGDLSPLIRGYNLARDQGQKPKPACRPKIVFTYFDNEPNDTMSEKVDIYGEPVYKESFRYGMARFSWEYHFGHFDIIEFPLKLSDAGRSSSDLGDPRPGLYIRDLLDYAVYMAMPEDIVVYANRDIGLTTLAPERIIEGVQRGRGVTVCPRRRMTPKAGRLYKSVLNCKTDGGFDIVAMTPEWWAVNRSKMPDMIIGNEAWDTVFRTLAEEWADGKQRVSRVCSRPEEWSLSKAYTDNVCWHIHHHSAWIKERKTSIAQKHNRALAFGFFRSRGNSVLCEQLSA